VATKASSVARSLELRHVDLGSTWMGDHQGRLGTVNLGPFVSVKFNCIDSTALSSTEQCI